MSISDVVSRVPIRVFSEVRDNTVTRINAAREGVLRKCSVRVWLLGNGDEQCFVPEFVYSNFQTVHAFGNSCGKRRVTPRYRYYGQRINGLAPARPSLACLITRFRLLRPHLFPHLHAKPERWTAVMARYSHECPKPLTLIFVTLPVIIDHQFRSLHSSAPAQMYHVLDAFHHFKHSFTSSISGWQLVRQSYFS